MSVAAGYVSCATVDDRMPHWLGLAARQLRVEADGVESEVAGKLRVHQSTISRFEHGQGVAPASRVGLERVLDTYVELYELESRYAIYARAIQLAEEAG